METNPPLKKSSIFFLCLLSGLLTGLSFPPVSLWFLVYFGMAILLFLIMSSSGLMQVFRRGYLALFFFNAITLYWVAGWESKDTFLKLGGVLTVLVHPLFFLLPVILVFWIKKYLSVNIALISFPFVWTAFEYWHNTGQLAFPWIELGNTECLNIYRIQYAEFTGVHGITFYICILTSLIWFLGFQFIKEKKSGRSIPIIVTCVIIILIIAPNQISPVISAKINQKLSENEQIKDSLDVAVIQANVDPFVKWKGNPDSLVDTYLQKLWKASETKPEMLVMHETATPFYFFEPFYKKHSERFLQLSDSTGIPLLLGIPHLYFYSENETPPLNSRVIKSTNQHYDAFNSAVFIEPKKDFTKFSIHKKVKLVPFSERVPYSDQLPFLREWIKWGVGISSWQSGGELIVFNYKKDNGRKYKFVTLICFESVFSEFVSEASLKDAEFLIIITNDGWFGNSSGPYQHQKFAVLRAIENRKWIVRCAQTGISSYIDPSGNIYDETKLNEEKTLRRKIVLNNYKTFYSIHGDIIGKYSMYISGLLLVCCAVFYVRSKIVRRKA